MMAIVDASISAVLLSELTVNPSVSALAPPSKDCPHRLRLPLALLAFSSLVGDKDLNLLYAAWRSSSARACESVFCRSRRTESDSRSRSFRASRAASSGDSGASSSAYILIGLRSSQSTLPWLKRVSLKYRSKKSQLYQGLSIHMQE